MQSRLIPTLFALLALASPAAALDQIRQSDGKSVTGTIDSISRTEVVIKNFKNELIKVPVNAIDSIRFDSEPPQLNLVRSAVKANNHDSALATLGNAALNVANAKRLEIQQDILFYKAVSNAKKAMGGDGDINAAGREMRDFVMNHGGSYHFFEAAEVVGDLLMATGATEEAIKQYEQLRQAPWDDYKMRAEVARGRALQQSKKPAEAKTAYQAAISIGQGKDSDPLVAQQLLAAKVGMSTALAETGQAAEGVKLVQEVINKAEPEETKLHAMAYIAKGRCHDQAGRKKEALMAYLHVDVVYFAYPQYHAEALYRLSKLWEEVGKPDRAKQAKETLKSKRFAGTSWAKLP